MVERPVLERPPKGGVRAPLVFRHASGAIASTSLRMVVPRGPAQQPGGPREPRDSGTSETSETLAGSRWATSACDLSGGVRVEISADEKVS